MTSSVYHHNILYIVLSIWNRYLIITAKRPWSSWLAVSPLTLSNGLVWEPWKHHSVATVVRWYGGKEINILCSGFNLASYVWQVIYPSWTSDIFTTKKCNKWSAPPTLWAFKAGMQWESSVLDSGKELASLSIQILFGSDQRKYFFSIIELFQVLRTLGFCCFLKGHAGDTKITK